MSNFRPTGILIIAQTKPCSSSCKFCLLSNRKTTNLSIDRCIGVVNKYLDYLNHSDFVVKQWFGNCYSFSLDDFKKLFDLFVRNGLDVKGTQDLRFLMLGGLPFMEDRLARQWLRERQAIGARTVSSTYAGLPPMHDALCSKKGHFRQQLDLQTIAVEEGFSLMQKIILLESNLPFLDTIKDEIGRAGEAEFGHVVLMFYSGHGRSFEAERPTRALLESQPARIRAIYEDDLPDWKTEREWFDLTSDSAGEPYTDWITLHLTAENIDDIEKKSCPEIIDRLTADTARAYSAIPAVDELFEKYADQASQKLYETSDEVEGLWVDRFLAQNPQISLNCSLNRFGW